MNNQKLQFENEQFKIYAPDTLKYIIKEVVKATYEQINEIYDFFNIKSFRKVQVNLFDNLDEFKKYIASIRNVEVSSLPPYCKGTFDKGMLNHFVPKDLLEDNKYYNKKIRFLVHELVHVMYNEIILNGDYNKRVVWLDEGLAQNISGEMNFLDFDKYFNWVINNTEELPSLNELKHGTSFVNDKYNGYALSYITVKYLLENTELLSIIKDYDKSIEVGKDALEKAIKYYEKKFKMIR